MIVLDASALVELVLDTSVPPIYRASQRCRQLATGGWRLLATGH